MRRVILITALFLSLILFIDMFAGCSDRLLDPKRRLPSKEKLEAVLIENADVFETVVDCLLENQSDECDIRPQWGISIFVDFKTIEITDPDFADAVEKLFDIGCEGISKNVALNNVSFVMGHFFNDTACGILYRIDPERGSGLQYLTEQTPIEPDNWFYFVTDYNEYRINHSQAIVQPLPALQALTATQTALVST